MALPAPDVLIAGAGPAVRYALGIGFSGGTYEQLFFVADTVTEDLATDAEAGRLLEIALAARLTGFSRCPRGAPASSGRCPTGWRRNGHLCRRAARAASRRAPAGAGGELVCRLPGAPPRGGQFPAGPGVFGGRRRPPAQPGRRAGHEYRPGRRRQPGLEAGRRAARRGPASPARHLRSRALAPRPVAGGHHRPGLHRCHPSHRRGQFRAHAAAPAPAAAGPAPAWVRRPLFCTVSQTDIAYSHSLLNQGGAGPALAVGPGRYAALRPVGRHVLSVGPGTAYLVRPDGYVGLAASSCSEAAFSAYATEWGIGE